MPRDSNGNYTLPPSNPVVQGTQITPAWANSTMQDIATALSQSLDRSGRGGMVGPTKVVNGSVAEPGLSFIGQPNTGFYYSGPDEVSLSINGTQKYKFTLQGLQIADRLSALSITTQRYVVPVKQISEPKNILGQIDINSYEANPSDTNLNSWCLGPFIRWGMPSDGPPPSGTLNDSVLELSAGAPVADSRPRFSVILSNELRRTKAGELYLRSENSVKLLGDWNGISRLSYPDLKVFKDDGSSANVYTAFDFDIASYAKLNAPMVSFEGDVSSRSLTALTGIGCQTLTVTESVSTGKLRVGTPVIPPTTSSSPGTKGDISYDSGFLYICVATNTWRRATLEVF